MNLSESVWTQVNPSYFEWTQANQGEPKWTQGNPSEPKWTQGNPSAAYKHIKSTKSNKNRITQGYIYTSTQVQKYLSILENKQPAIQNQNIFESFEFGR